MDSILLLLDSVISFGSTTLPTVHILSSVINDLSTDQRVDKSCQTLLEMGHTVKVFCRSHTHSRPLHKAYGHERMELIFRRGALFYAEFNVRLFFKLVRSGADAIIANDLDTLLASYLASRIKKIPLIYDSHEYFTEVDELQGRWSKKVWLAIEKRIFPTLKRVYTVNKSIADIYSKKYGVNVEVVRNLPSAERVGRQKDRLVLALPQERHILILQGSGINVNRGGEELIDAMAILPASYLLLVIGGGDVFDELGRRVQEKGLEEQVYFFDRMPYERMMQYTMNADLGLTLDKNTNLNYLYSLPNKLFDYIAAGIPVLSSNLVELKRIIEEYKIGEIVTEVDPKLIAEKIASIFAEPETLRQMKENTNAARAALIWENEIKPLKRFIREIEIENQGK